MWDKILLMLPQLLMISLTCMGLGIHLANHGKEIKKTETFGTSLVAVLIVQGLLIWGGFYNVFFK